MATKRPATTYKSLVFDAFASFASYSFIHSFLKHYNNTKNSEKMIGVTRGVTRGVTLIVQKLTDKRGNNVKKTSKKGFFFG